MNVVPWLCMLALPSLMQYSAVGMICHIVQSARQILCHHKLQRVIHTACLALTFLPWLCMHTLASPFSLQYSAVGMICHIVQSARQMLWLRKTVTASIQVWFQRRWLFDLNSPHRHFSHLTCPERLSIATCAPLQASRCEERWCFGLTAPLAFYAFEL